MEKIGLPKMTKFGKWVAMVLLAIILVWPLTVGLYWIVYSGYAAMDRTKFPDLDPEIRAVMEKAPADVPDPDKGVALSMAIRNRL